MADTVTTQVLFDGKKKAVIKFTNVSDGSGESAVAKIDVSTLLNAPTAVKISRIWYTLSGMAVQMLWDATTDVLAFVLGIDSSGSLDFTSFGGLVNNAGAGVTGDLLFTTVGHTAGDSYSIILEVTK
jgi:hypothetical protein